MNNIVNMRSIKPMHMDDLELPIQSVFSLNTYEMVYAFASITHQKLWLLFVYRSSTVEKIIQNKIY